MDHDINTVSNSSNSSDRSLRIKDPCKHNRKNKSINLTQTTAEALTNDNSLLSPSRKFKASKIKADAFNELPKKKKQNEHK